MNVENLLPMKRKQRLMRVYVASELKVTEEKTMRSSAKVFLAAVLMVAGVSISPASAQGLLGGLLGGDGDSGGGGGSGGGLLGGVTDTVGDVVGGLTDGLGGSGGGSGGGGGSFGGNLADIGSGPAGNSSLVNVGIGPGGGNNNNIADVKIGNGGTGGLLGGNGGTLAGLNVTGGNGQGGLLNSGGLLGTGLLDGDDDGGLLGSGILGSNLTAGLNLGGLGLDLTVPGLGDLLGGGNGGGGNGGGGNGGGGNGGNGGAGGNGGIGAGGAGGRVLVGSIDGSYQVNCSVNDGRKVLQLASQAKVNPGSWQRAANVQVIPIKLCPAARNQVAQIFNASGKIMQLQRAAAGDMLITASLSRTRYDVNDVFAVQASGGRLVVYVY